MLTGQRGQLSTGGGCRLGRRRDPAVDLFQLGLQRTHPALHLLEAPPPFAKAAPDRRKLAFQGGGFAPDAVEADVLARRGLNEGRPNQRALGRHELLLRSGAMPGRGLRQVADQEGASEQAGGERVDPGIRAQGIEQRAVAGDPLRWRCPVGDGEQHAGAFPGRRVAEGVVLRAVDDRVGERPKGGPHGGPQVRRRTDQLVKNPHRAVSPSAGEGRAGGFRQVLPPGFDGLLARLESAFVRLQAGELVGEGRSFGSQGLELRRHRLLAGVEALHVVLQLAGVPAQGQDPDGELPDRRGQPIPLGPVALESQAQRLGLRPACRGLVLDSPAVLLGIPPGELRRPEGGLGDLELALPGRERPEHLRHRLLGPDQLLLQGEQPAAAIRGRGKAVPGGRLLTKGHAERCLRR